MRFQTVWACAGTFAIAALAGCNGSFGDVPSGSGGSGSGIGNAGGSSNTGTGGAGNTSTTGTAGTGATPVPGKLDLTGSPKYFRVVRLTNVQWAQAVQTLLNVPSGGLEENF